MFRRFSKWFFEHSDQLHPGYGLSDLDSFGAVKEVIEDAETISDIFKI